jgi:hypothetical protein
VIVLALTATLLVAKGPAGGPSGAPGQAGATGDGPMLERIRYEFLRENPLLSPGEADRMVAAVMRCNETYGLAPDLVAGVISVESTARPWAVSPKGAVGLMQVMPHMYELFDLAGNITTIESNIEAGCLILSDNIRRLGENDGILAYFWGAQIRGVSYLDRVREARAELREPLESRS